VELRLPVNNVTSYVNNNTLISIALSTGYTIGAGQKQVPTYATPITGYAQIQAVTNEELQHIDGMNLQGTYKVLYLSGQLFAAVRPEELGGDLVTIDGEVWLVTQLLERWSTWCKVFICLQSP
jgi:hypothetical protein